MLPWEFAPNATGSAALTVDNNKAGAAILAQSGARRQVSYKYLFWTKTLDLEVLVKRSCHERAHEKIT